MEVAYHQTLSVNRAVRVDPGFPQSFYEPLSNVIVLKDVLAAACPAPGAGGLPESSNCRSRRDIEL